MLRSIFYKEILKIRWYWLTLIALNLLLMIYIYMETRHLFAMDRNHESLKRITHTMSRARITPLKKLYDVIFPFSLGLNAKGGEYLHMSLQPGGCLSFIGLLVCIIGVLIWSGFRYKRLPGIPWLCLVLLTGVYGVIAFAFLGLEE